MRKCIYTPSGGTKTLAVSESAMEYIANNKNRLQLTEYFLSFSLDHASYRDARRSSWSDFFSKMWLVLVHTHQRGKETLLLRKSWT